MIIMLLSPKPKLKSIVEWLGSSNRGDEQYEHCLAKNLSEYRNVSSRVDFTWISKRLRQSIKMFPQSTCLCVVRDKKSFRELTIFQLRHCSPGQTYFPSAMFLPRQQQHIKDDSTEGSNNVFCTCRIMSFPVLPCTLQRDANSSVI